MVPKISSAVVGVAAVAATTAGTAEGFVFTAGSGSLARTPTGGVVAAVRSTSPSYACRAPRRNAGKDCRLSMITGAEAQVADSTNLLFAQMAGAASTHDNDNTVLFAQMAGCTSLIGAGYKITWDKGEEGEGESEAAGDGEVDIYRDTALRYLGYANECGEAFRPLVPEYVVVLSYAVAVSYVTADAVSKGFKCAKESDSKACALPASFDVLTFQMLASVVFPGFTINRWVAFVTYCLDTFNAEAQFPGIMSWLPTAAGLALIPFIVAPLDNLVEAMLDRTIRPILVDKFPSCELEPIFGMEPLP